MSSPALTYPIAELNFTSHCALLVPLSRAWDAGFGQQERQDHKDAILSIRKVLPPADLQTYNITDDMLVAWWNLTMQRSRLDLVDSDMNTDLFVSAWEHPLNLCRGEVCQSLEWRGNPDLIGVGVVSSYVVQLVLLTHVLVGFALRGLVWSANPRSWTSRFANAYVAATTRTPSLLLEGSVVFSISITVASIQVVFDPVYYLESIFCVLLAEFSAGAAATLVALGDGVVSTRTTRMLIYFVPVVQGPFFMVFLATGPLSRHLTLYQSICDLESDFWLASSGAIGGAIILVYLLTIAVTAASVLYPARQRHHAARLAGQGCASVYIKALCVGILYSLTVISFVFLVVGRRRYLDHPGDNKEEQSWRFGQVLALFIWVPTIFSMIAIFFERFTPPCTDDARLRSWSMEFLTRQSTGDTQCWLDGCTVHDTSDDSVPLRGMPGK